MTSSQWHQFVLYAIKLMSVQGASCKKAAGGGGVGLVLGAGNQVKNESAHPSPGRVDIGTFAGRVCKHMAEDSLGFLN